ncbi:MAG TPA: 1-(5-phosphoribosyl)-5-[(5-phosphoribosylamino)methylideneamino]imidazole-4-carboxamide isomerase [Candidatus Dormibacteraeota bacterium]|nr:1-(5-phosphoribosyl)-5-[(5-phosphoribosylamino)methylideneamino]imidazole-4-carboxamide isomerase [Candidatus Dormibacteraeota bacterium]
MLVIPAIDILGGRCVRLVRGDYANPTVYSEDPVEVAATFAKAGATRVHVVDLDAARGGGDNRDLIETIVRQGSLELQVAGGIRTESHVDALLAGGAHSVVMGTAAVREPRLLERCVRKHTRRVLAALDIRDNQPSVSGWTETEPLMIGSLLARWDVLALAGVILTCIDRDGTLEGPDLKTLTRVRAMTSLPVQYSGGISSIEDIQNVTKAGAAGVILGKALYEGRVTLEQALAL